MQMACNNPRRAELPTGRSPKALRKRQKPIDASLVKSFWSGFSQESRMQHLAFKDRKLVGRAFEIQEELKRREQECFNKGIATTNHDGKQVMSVSLACFGFHWNEKASEGLVAPDAFFVHGALLSLSDEQLFAYLDSRLGATFAGSRGSLRREQWHTIFEAMPNSWTDFELQSLKLVEQAILTVFLEADSLLSCVDASLIGEDDAIDDSWIDDEAAPPSPSSSPKKKKTQRRLPQNRVAQNKINKSTDSKSASKDRCTVAGAVALDTSILLPTCNEDAGLEECDFETWTPVTRKKLTKAKILDEVGRVDSTMSMATVSTTMSSDASDSVSDMCSTDNVINAEIPSVTIEDCDTAFEKGRWIPSIDLLGWYFCSAQSEQDKEAMEGCDGGILAASYRVVAKRTFLDLETPTPVACLPRLRSRSVGF